MGAFQVRIIYNSKTGRQKQARVLDPHQTIGLGTG